MRYPILIILFLLYACSERHSESWIYAIEPTGTVISSEEAYRHIVDTIFYVQIDDSVLIPSLGGDYHCITDNYLFFNTKQGLLKYDWNGKFLQKIGEIGEGPKEYCQYPNIAVDNDNCCLFVYSRPKTILVYSFDGILLNRYHIDMPEDGNYPKHLYYYDGCLYFFYTNGLGGDRDNYKPLFWVIATTNGTILSIRRASQKKVRQISYKLYNNLSANQTYSDSFIFWDLFNDTIFYVNSEKVNTAYLWKKDNYRVRESDYDSLGNERLFSLNLFDTKRFLWIFWTSMDVSDLSKKSMTLYDRKTKQIYRFDNLYISEKNSNVRLPINLSTYMQYKGREYILFEMKSKDLYNIPGALRWGIDENDEEGNPVLVLIRLKDE